MRVVYPQLGVGISFSGMLEPDRMALQDLLRAVAPKSVVLNSVIGNRSAVIPRLDPLPPEAQAAQALQAISHFFEDRHVMGRDEFLKILRGMRGSR